MIPPDWNKTMVGQDVIWTHPGSNMDFASLPSDFFQAVSPTEQATRLIWMNGLENLANTNNEIIVPFNVGMKHGIDMLRELASLLGKHLDTEAIVIFDPTITAFRIYADMPPQPILPIGLYSHRTLSNLLQAAVNDGLAIPLEPARIPRPPNSFILYRQHHHHTVTAANPGIPNTQISRIIADMWRNETPEVRNDFKELAEERKRLHAQAYPNYQYSPRRPSERVRRTHHVHVNRVPWLGGSTDGQQLINDAVNNTEGFIPVEPPFISAADATGLIKGPNGIAPSPAHDASNLERCVQQQLDRVVVETVRWEPLQGNEFDDTFPMDEMLDLEGA